jgi:hypothetical protein
MPTTGAVLDCPERDVHVRKTASEAIGVVFRFGIRILRVE